MLSQAEVGDSLNKCAMLIHLQEKVGRPDRTIIDTPEIFQISDPSMPITTCNTVLRANFEESRVEERISEVIGSFRAMKVPFRWAVSSLSTPNDLAERLGKRNPPHIVESVGFAISCERMPILSAPHVTVEDLSADNIQNFILAATESFAEKGQAAVDALKTLAHDEIARPNPDSLSFLARYKGQPAGIGRMKILRDGARIAGYIGGGGVRPCFRHRGIVRGVSHFAKELQRRGIPLLLAHGDEATSAPIMRRLGFHSYGKIRFFMFPNSISER